MKTDIYRKITDTIVSQLEKGVRPWQKPWDAAHTEGRIARPLRYSGVPYNGINVLILWIEALEKTYASPYWMTYRQAVLLNAHVRKGEHGVSIVYSDKITRAERDQTTGEEATTTIPFIKAYYVYNAEQIEGLPEHYYAKPAPRLDTITRITHAETFFANLKIDLRHNGTMAYYDMKHDYIRLPPFESFRDAEAYYATLAHECTHWTGHSSRLDRALNPRFGEESYAMEELVAELGAAFLCAGLDLSPEPREDHAAYIEYWIDVLKNDKRAIFTASSQAQRAADYLNSLQTENAGGET